MSNKSFLRQNSKLLKKLGHKWRKPRGRQSKMRERRAGKAPVVTIGYGTTAATRNFHPRGLMEVMVSNVSDLQNVAKNQVARITSAVGAKKRFAILIEAKKSGVKVLNANEVKLRTIVNAHKKKETKEEKKPTKETKKKEE